MRNFIDRQNIIISLKYLHLSVDHIVYKNTLIWKIVLHAFEILLAMFNDLNMYYVTIY